MNNLEDSVPESILFKAIGAHRLHQWGKSGYSLYLSRGIVEHLIGSQDELGKMWCRISVEGDEVRLQPLKERKAPEKHSLKYLGALAELDSADLQEEERAS